MLRLAIRSLCLLILLACQLAAQDGRGPNGSGALTLDAVTQGKANIVDLSYPLNQQTNFWPGDDYEPFSLQTIATLEKDGVLSKSMRLPEHIGTHIDAPNHFEPNQPDVAQIKPEDLIGPGVMIDISPQAEVDPDYGLTLKDVQAWESAHGRIPDGAIVLLYTGWGRFWSRPERFQGRDTTGNLHFPSYTAESASFLIQDRKARGLGVDTLSIDRGISKDFQVHHITNSATRYGLENIAHLDQLPPHGFTLIVAPMKIEKGTGCPTRVFAILPK
ncbi:MAG: cyclase family protein [Planctomycetaceae bacterium]|nr:cyclase family protein [Planctomycetaceae bacterium]